MEHVIAETVREVFQAVEDEKTDKQLYRLDSESMVEDQADNVILPISEDTPKVKASEEVEDLALVFAEKEITESTPDTVITSYTSNQEMKDLSGNESTEVTFTAKSNLVIKGE